MNTKNLPSFEWVRAFREHGPDDAKAKAVGFAAATYADADGTSVRPGNARLIRATSMSDRSVRRALQVLEGTGWLTVVQEHTLSSATIYRLSTPTVPVTAPPAEAEAPTVPVTAPPAEAEAPTVPVTAPPAEAEAPTVPVTAPYGHTDRTPTVPVTAPYGLCDRLPTHTNPPTNSYQPSEASTLASLASPPTNPDTNPPTLASLASAGTNTPERTGEEMSALSGTHRQKVKRISELSGVEEILFTGEEDEGDYVPQPGEESTGEEDEGLSAQSGLPLDVDDWDDPLPSPSAAASVPSAPPVAALPTEPRQPSAAVSDDDDWGDLPSVLPAAVEPPVASELHCSRCDSHGHSYWDEEACPLVDTADAEAAEVDEAPQPEGRVITMLGRTRRLTPSPAAAEPQRYVPRWGRSS